MKFMLVVGSILFSGAFSLATGTSSSGGGGAFICTTGSRVTQTHLMDLWEASNVLNYNVPLSNEAAELQFDRAVAKLSVYDSELAAKIKKIANEIFKNHAPLKAGVRLAPPTDLYAAYMPEGCFIVGMMYYDGFADHLAIDEEYFSELATQTDVAAAVLHEAYYYLARQMQQNDRSHYKFRENSIYVRRLVGCLFSTDQTCLGTVTKESLIKMASQIKHCRGPQSDVTLITRPQGFSNRDIPFLGNLDSGVIYSSDTTTGLAIINKLFGDVYERPFVVPGNFSPYASCCASSELNKYGYNPFQYVGLFAGTLVHKEPGQKDTVIITAKESVYTEKKETLVCD
ncbi:MAG: hypothetical protein H7061_13735 [Bdellovibrionaceae bacterium]|nr:hypothetical protein [Bdellovibrio sp.]